jgi:hypothetical protein
MKGPSAQAQAVAPKPVEHSQNPAGKEQAIAPHAIAILRIPPLLKFEGWVYYRQPQFCCRACGVAGGGAIIEVAA